MKKALYDDKNTIVDILTSSFDSNKSVNYIVKQDAHRQKRIAELMDYSFEVCHRFGEVYLSDDSKACALILYPSKKKTTLGSLLLDLKLIINSVGISNIKKTLNRESLIKKIQPKEEMYYLWFIGVEPVNQRQGAGSRLLKQAIKESEEKQLPIYLETSTLENLPWYKSFGFEVYNELDLGYNLYFLKRKPQS